MDYADDDPGSSDDEPERKKSTYEWGSSNDLEKRRSNRQALEVEPKDGFVDAARLVPGNLDASRGEYARERDQCAVFTWLTILACTVVLAWEFHANANLPPSGLPQCDGKRRDGENGELLKCQPNCCQFNYTVYGKQFCAEPVEDNIMFGPCAQVLDLAGKNTAKIVQGGEPWRLVTYMYLHAGVVHYLGNMGMLFQLRAIENAHGFVSTGAIYMASGIFASIMSALFASEFVTVGASGAIMGLLGAMLGEMIQNWGVHESPCGSIMTVVLCAVVQLALGTMPTVDNFAHFWGFVMGFVCSLYFLIQQRETSRGVAINTKKRQRFWQLIALVAVPTAFVCALALLYGYYEQNVNDLCPLCNKISCIPFPWGCDPKWKDCWWECPMGNQLEKFNHTL